MPSQLQRTQLGALFDKSQQELGWPEVEEEPKLIGSPSLLYDPLASVNRSILTGQQTLLKIMQASCLAGFSQHRTMGLIGLPGCGKTAVAAALTAIPKIRQTFGIL